jgi:hypothetical protein
MSDYNEHLISMAGGDGDVLGEIEARRADCQTYNFGMRNADKLAKEDVPYLLALVREQAAKLDALEELASGWKPPRDDADLDDTQVWYSFAKHHAAQAIRNIVRGL